MSKVDIRKKTMCLLISLMMLIGMVIPVTSLSVRAEAFKYIHDPTENPSAMKDIVKDENAIYGFRPSETGSIKQYAAADWTDPEVVEAGRQQRIAYHNRFSVMYDMLSQMESEGKSVEEIARAISAKRNEIRFESYVNDPAGLEALKQRNLEEFGHEEGPLPDELFEEYGSWEKVIEKAFSTNAGMDACLGLYDDYYHLYVVLGQVGDGDKTDSTVQAEAAEVVTSPKTGDDSRPGQWIVLMFLSASGTAAMIVIGKKKAVFKSE